MMLSWYLAGRTDEITKISVNITRVQADIYTWDLPKLECYFISVLFEDILML
jgi:hypothetical protein